MPALDLRHGGASLPAPGRILSEDALGSREPASPLERLTHGSIWVIADGVGPDARGAEAGTKAVELVIAGYWESIAPNPVDRLRDALEATNTVLFEANDPAAGSGQRFGATALAAAIVSDRLFIAHAGRSRAYLLRDGVLKQLTNDHTWTAEQVREGKLDPAEATGHSRSNMLMRALGIRPAVTIDLHESQLQPGDVLLLCSDGLHRWVGDVDIVSILNMALASGADPAAALATGAIERGARDDTTVVVVRAVAATEARGPALDRLSLLLRVGPELTGSLDLDRTLSAVLRRLLELTGGDRAAILLRTPGGGVDDLSLRIGHNLATQDDLVGFSRGIAGRAVRERKPALIDDALADALDRPALDTESIVAQGIRAAACVPLLIKDDAIGALYVDSPTRAGVFDVDDLDLLVAFASLAAPAIENARLHAALLERTREIESERRRQDALVRSLSSGLIALDPSGVIRQWNPAAEEIFGVGAGFALGKPLGEALPGSVAGWLSGMIVEAQLADRTLLMGQGWEGPLRGEARVVLAGRVAMIRDVDGPSGFVFIVNDRTDIALVEEARRRDREDQERQRTLFSRYLAPSVVERALRRPESVQLGGARQVITVLFADMRGFTGYSEGRAPEEVVEALNQYLALATTEIFNQFGTLDKFIGDGVMAIFGAPLAVEEHALAAVRAALAIRDRLQELRRTSGTNFGFGFGINSGEALVGNIGTTQLMNYTAIGDVVNVAARLQADARAGEVLISQATLEAAGTAIEVEELGAIYVKGRSVPILTYKALRELP